MTRAVISHSWPGGQDAGVVRAHPGRHGFRPTATQSRLLILSIALLIGLAAALCAPLAPLFDPDEGYYPATAAETLRDGSFWDLHFNDAPRWDKPLLSYALIETAFGLVGESAAAARLPSALEAAALVLIVGMSAVRLAGGRAGVLCALVVGSTLGIGIFSRAAHPELGVVTSVIATELLLCVWLATTDRAVQRWVAAASGIALAVGLLTKGPVAAVLPLLMLAGLVSIGQLTRGNARPFARDVALSVLVAAALSIPWYALMTDRHGWKFLYESVWQQNIGRYTTTSYGHASGVLTVWLPALLGVLPWPAVVLQGLRQVRLRPSGSRELLRTGMCLGSLSALVFYSLSSSKLPSYALAAVPGLGIVAGLYLDDWFDEPLGLQRVWHQNVGVLACLGVGLLTTPLWIGRFLEPRQLLGSNRPPGADSAALVAPVTLTVGCLLISACLALTVKRRSTSATVVLALVGTLIPVVALVSAAPTLREMYPWEKIGQQVDPRYGPLWLFGRRAPSLTFYARAPVRVASDPQALQGEIQHHPYGWLVATVDEWEELSGRLPVEGSVVESRGRMVLVRLAPGGHE